MTRKTRLFLSVSVSTAIPTLPVQRSHLQTAAEQTQQGTGRPRHVCISGGYFRPCFSEPISLASNLYWFIWCIWMRYESSLNNNY